MNSVAVAANGMGSSGGILSDSYGVLPYNWDLLLQGMIPGEERVITAPNSFFNVDNLEKQILDNNDGENSVGFKLLKLQLNVKLISLNGD